MIKNLELFESSIKELKAKPFLKWAGGKTQLLEQFEKYFPEELIKGKIKYYIEPFLGSGAVYFFVIQKYNIKKAYLADINEELVLTYNVVKNDVQTLIKELKNLKEKYNLAKDKERENIFYLIRKEFNEKKKRINFNKYNKNWIERAAEIIFLNKTCFNGLFRLNKMGEFNVPFGRYRNPKILDTENLIRVSKVLENTEILRMDFAEIKKYIKEKTFIYLDPPYRPISKTASFTSYSRYEFSDKEQIRLAELYRELGNNSNKIMLSNSDPKNENPDDDFFELHFKGFYINKVKALRMINCNANKRGAINELIITNYKPSIL